MKPLYRSLTLRDVLPSALIITILGLAACYWLPSVWTLNGRLGWAAAPLGAVSGVLLYGICFFATQAPMINRLSVQQLNQTLHQLFRNFSWRDILIVSCLAGVGEELLVRGALQSWLSDAINPWVGILLASLVFGLMHYLSRVYVIVTMLLGCLFGIGLYLSQSIIYVVVAHAAYDVMAFFIIVKRPHMLGLDSNDETSLLPIRDRY
ncbi:CPBP family intramembrane glutamic endopeptidase [Arenicella xantha]|uniref:CPBP family intramembrane glutamic endopeptidase n=1 Tax=Arenicella xantha TaxID=644221 RepID=UPI00147587FC|nr:CPBP family intramembrane glutamic endopeptidase [Arenicella xantha]